MNRILRRTAALLTALFLTAPALAFSSCSRKSGTTPAEEAERNDIISFLGEEPGGRGEDGRPGGKNGQNAASPLPDAAEPHPLFYLNGVWSATGAYDDDLFYDYDEIEEMSLVFENGWVAMTADGSTTLHALEQEGDMLFFTVQGGGELGNARVIIDYYDNGYLLGLIPENDPSFELLFERQ